MLLILSLRKRNCYYTMKKNNDNNSFRDLNLLEKMLVITALTSLLSYLLLLL
jgi:hypothetical protein